MGLKSWWPLQLIEHLTNTSSVTPPCMSSGLPSSVYVLSPLVETEFKQYGLQIGAAYSSLGHIKSLYATSLVLLGAKAKFLRRFAGLVCSHKGYACVNTAESLS